MTETETEMDSKQKLTKYINSLYTDNIVEYRAYWHRYSKNYAGTYKTDNDSGLNDAAAEYYHFYNILEHYFGFDDIVSFVGVIFRNDDRKYGSVVTMFLMYGQCGQSGRNENIDNILRKTAQRFLNKQPVENLKYIFNKIKKSILVSPDCDTPIHMVDRIPYYKIATLHNIKRVLRPIFCEDITNNILEFLI